MWTSWVAPLVLGEPRIDICINAGHILRLPKNRPAYKAMNWLPDNGKQRPGRPTKTWRATLKEDLQDMGLTWMGAEICQRQTEMEKARRPMFRLEHEELRSKVINAFNTSCKLLIIKKWSHLAWMSGITIFYL